MSVVTGLFIDNYLKCCCLELIGYGQADHRARYVNDLSSLRALPTWLWQFAFIKFGRAECHLNLINQLGLYMFKGGRSSEGQVNPSYAEVQIVSAK